MQYSTVYLYPSEPTLVKVETTASHFKIFHNKQCLQHPLHHVIKHFNAPEENLAISLSYVFLSQI